MSDRAVSYEIRNDVCILKILGPPTDENNLMQLSYQLSDFCNEVNAKGELRVVVVADASGDALGFKKEMFAGHTVIHEMPTEKGRSLAEPISNIDRPVIAAITGDALGMGLELVLGCDIRIAAETSHFGMPHVKENMIPRDGGTQRLSRLVGRGKALEMTLTGRQIDAREAQRIGLVNKLAPKEAVMTAAEEMANEMASKGPISLRYTKEAVNKGMDMTLEQGLRLEADLYMLIHTTVDREEGIRAFQEKRMPEFKGE
ncbi:MAG: enoyl-CoA hydratase/isomerase family protein [Deltaproteobacteria bacterium]|nr:enoyl-CoA hydratase/isomerase family protein [Deltaproteobacteria bacterium]